MYVCILQMFRENESEKEGEREREREREWERWRERDVEYGCFTMGALARLSYLVFL